MLMTIFNDPYAGCDWLPFSHCFCQLFMRLFVSSQQCCDVEDSPSDLPVCFLLGELQAQYRLYDQQNQKPMSASDRSQGGNLLGRSPSFSKYSRQGTSISWFCTSISWFCTMLKCTCVPASRTTCGAAADSKAEQEL